MKRTIQISTLFFLLLAVGCSSQAETPTLYPSKATIENIATQKPTFTPANSITPTPEQITIEFPEWVKNPETQILLVPVGTRENGYENIALFNAETGQRFDIPFTEEIGDYFWMPDGSAFGFLPNDQKYITLFSIRKGIITTTSTTDSALKFLFQNSRADPIRATNSNITDSAFLFPIISRQKIFYFRRGK